MAGNYSRMESSRAADPSPTYTANDPQSGVAHVSVFVGKTEAGAVDFAAQCEFAALAACPVSRSGSIAVDTRKLADGIYPVSLRVSDAAGNEQTIQAVSAIQIRNVTPPALPEAGSVLASSGVQLSVAFAASRRPTLTVGYGRRVVVRGRLVRDDGVGVPGAQIEVEQTPTLSGAQVLRGAVVTASDGTFAFTAPRGATSRVLTFAYGANPGGATAVSQRLRLRVKASATLRIALKGSVVRYRGRVLSKPLPRSGKLVELQGRAPGSAWTTFARHRTNRRGDFSGRYRLRIRRPGVRLNFRVRVPAERAYPFVAHAGRVVTRIVR